MGKINIGSSNLSKAYIGTDEIQKIYFGNDLVYSAYTPEHYLKFTSPNSFTLKMNNNKGWDGTMEYSTNGGSSWSTWGGSSTLTAGSVDGSYAIYLRGTGNTKVSGSGSNWSNAHYFVFTGSNISCTGNIEYLLDYATVAQGNHPPMASYCYNYLFYGCTNLTTAPELPATTLSSYCYALMFYNCDNITALPDLPATTLAQYCYYFMFGYCDGITSIPTNYLPATTLAIYCYYYMFCGCSNLYYTLPDLPATTLKTSCYSFMFYQCSRLGLYTSSQSNTVTYRIPKTGTGTTATEALMGMFSSTGAMESGTLGINSTHYLSTIPLARKPYNVACSPNGSGSTLSWDCSETNATYVIYRSSTANGTYTQVTTTSNKTYTISSSYKGYYFKVKTTKSGYRDSQLSDYIQNPTSWKLSAPYLFVDDDSRPDVLIENTNSVTVTYHYGTSYGSWDYSGTLGGGNQEWQSDGISFYDTVYVYFSADGWQDSDISEIYVYH